MALQLYGGSAARLVWLDGDSAARQHGRRSLMAVQLYDGSAARLVWLDGDSAARQHGRHTAQSTACGM